MDKREKANNIEGGKIMNSLSENLRVEILNEFFGKIIKE